MSTRRATAGTRDTRSRAHAGGRWVVALAMCTAAVLATGERVARADEPDEPDPSDVESEVPPLPAPEPSAPSVAPPVVVAAPPAPAPSAGSVSVEVVDSAGAVLEMRDAATGDFEPLCHAPCRRTVPSDGVYRIAGDGISPSYGFGLRRSGGRPIVLHVEAADPVALAFGIVLGSLSMPVGYGGLLLSTDGLRCRTCGDRPMSVNNDGRKVAGGVMMGAAAVAALVGTYLVATNRRTTVEQVVERSPAPMPRAPDFRGASSIDMPSATFTSILGGRF